MITDNVKALPKFDLSAEYPEFKGTHRGRSYTIRLLKCKKVRCNGSRYAFGVGHDRYLSGGSWTFWMDEDYPCHEPYWPKYFWFVGWRETQEEAFLRIIQLVCTRLDVELGHEHAEDVRNIKHRSEFDSLCSELRIPQKETPADD